MIGVSDGRQYQSEFEAELGPISNESSTAARRPSTATEKPAGEFKVDRGYNVPLIAAKTPEGIAIDHRVDTNMEFDGKKHDITPFLITHENAEIGPMEDLIKGGMDAKHAYELAHDKAANPAEASARFAYAAKNNLDPEEFNKAYYAHIARQAEIAMQPSDKPRHPDAHTTRYGLDPGMTRLAMSSDDERELMGRQRFQMEAGGGAAMKPVNDNSNVTKLPIDESVKEFNQNKKLTPEEARRAESREKFGLDQPVDLERHKWLKDIGHYDKSDSALYDKALYKQSLEKADEFTARTGRKTYEAPSADVLKFSDKIKHKPAADQLRDWFKPEK